MVEELLLHRSEGLEKGLVVAIIQAADEQGERAEINGHLRLRLVGAGAQGRQVDRRGSRRLGELIAHGVVGARASTQSTAEGQQLVLAVAHDGLDLWCVDDLGLEVDALEGDGAREDRVDDEVGVGAEFVAGECGEGVEQQRRGGVVCADGDEVQALVGLEAVAAVPVAARLDERLGSLDLLLDEGLVAVEEPHAYYGQHQVDLGAQDARLFEQALKLGNCFVLRRITLDSARISIHESIMIYIIAPCRPLEPKSRLACPWPP